MCVCARAEKKSGDLEQFTGPWKTGDFGVFWGGVQKQGFLGVFGWVVFFEVFDGVRFFFCGEKKSFVCVVRIFFVSVV